MADEQEQSQAVAEAPDEATEATEAAEESTKPTPVRESLGSPGEVTRTARERALGSVRESIQSRQEEAAEAPEEPEGAEEPSEEAEAAEATAEPDQKGHGDGVPTPPDERVTEDVPEGTYREESTGRLKDASSHRYVEEPKAEADEDTEAAASDDEGAPPTPESDAPAVPEGFERVELPENHPLRDRGETHMDIPSAELVGEQRHQYYRHLVNAGSQMRELQQQMAAQQEQLARHRIAQQVAQADDVKQLDPEHNAELRERIEEYERAFGEEAVRSDILEPLEARRKQLVGERTQEALSERQQVSTATRFVGQAAEVANRFYEDMPGHVQMLPARDPNTGETRYVLSGQGKRHQMLQQALHRYGAYVEKAGAPPNIKEFFANWVEPVYFNDPEVRQRLKEQSEQREQSKEQQIEEKVRQERKEAERERLEDAAERRKTNPHAQTPSVSTDKQTPRPEPETVETEGKSARQIRDAVMQQLGIR